jgi:type VI secretion system protein ImpH
MSQACSEKHHRLKSILAKEPGRFEATTAFRIAENLSEEVLDIRVHTGVSPAPLAVNGFGGVGERMSIRSSLAGLTGPLGSLPPYYNELIMRQERGRSHGLSSFLDLFSARMSSFFVAACEKYRLARRIRWNNPLNQNSFVTTLLSLAGFGTKGLTGRSGVEENLILRFSGFFSARTRNASNLRAMLSEFTGLPVDIELFRGRWLTIPTEDRSQLGRNSAVQLGVNATAGTAIQDFSGGFRIVIGPLDYSDYLSLSPDGPVIKEIFDLARLYCGAGLDFDIQIILSKEEIPYCRLGDAANPPRLGWNSWARVAPANRDSGDAIIARSLSTQLAG